MPVAPRPLAIAVLVCRIAVALLSAAAFACAAAAPTVYFTTFMYLKFALSAQLLWTAVRLLYDAAQVWLHAPLLPLRYGFTALVTLEWVVMIVVFAAGSSSMAVVIFLEIDTRACELLRTGACSHWNWASAALTLGAWFFSAVIAVLMFVLRASLDHQD